MAGWPGNLAGDGENEFALPQRYAWGRAPISNSSSKTLEIPTTLPTWDEMLALDGVNRRNIVDETWKLLKSDRVNVWTVHAELEGTAYFPQFHEFIERAGREGCDLGLFAGLGPQTFG